MLSHLDMANAGAGGGFKLFGKVITQCSEATQTTAPVFLPQDAAADSARRLHDERLDRTPAVKREAAYMDADKQHPSQQGGDQARRTQLQESAEARAAAAPLPCPRCRSRETKFCYFNNYNVNQPRHFCKACHRYWTAGGALRNVPVGAGRRKNRPLGPIATAVAGFHHRGGAAAGFVLGFPSPTSPSPTSPSPLYADHRWQLGPDRRF